VSGKYKDQPAQTSIDACIDCGPGQSGNAAIAATGCEACFTEGDGECVQCEAGKYDAGASCVKCLPGQFQDGTGKKDCKACPAHSSSEEASDKLEDCRADAGYTGSGASIVACAAGTFKATAQSSVECTNCAAGQYSGAEAATECTGCSAGKFLPSEGAKSVDDCQACDFGKYSTTVGANSPDVCVACGSELIPDQLRSGCLACPSFIIPGRGAQPTLCPKGVLDLNYVKNSSVWWNKMRDADKVTIFHVSMRMFAYSNRNLTAQTRRHFSAPKAPRTSWDILVSVRQEEMARFVLYASLAGSRLAANAKSARTTLVLSVWLLFSGLSLGSWAASVLNPLWLKKK
jgi:hypothetical protein